MPDTPEFEEVDDFSAGFQEGNGGATVSHSYREHIVDRTGELLESAMDVAEKHLRIIVTPIEDPRDGTRAYIGLGKGEALRVNADLFDEYRETPLRRSGLTVHTRLDSFIAITNRFKSDNSAVFANDSMTAPSVVTVFDYHPETEDNLDAANLHHRASYAFPLSEEWKAWSKINGQFLDLTSFAQFIEDHIVDVLGVDAESGLSDAAKGFTAAIGGKMGTPTRLVELSRGLTIHENAVVKDMRKLSSGEGELTFQSEHVDSDGKPLVIPSWFVIAIPVFARSTVAYRIVVRLRYRKTGGGVVFCCEMWRPDLVFTDAFEEAIARVANETGLPVFVGAPEKFTAETPPLG